jgi:hypothetical protein
VNVFAAEGGQLDVDVRALEFASPINRPEIDRPPLDRLEDLEAALDAIERRVGPIRPSGPIRAGQITAEQERYFVLRDLADEIGRALDRLFDRYSDDRLARLEARQPDALGRKARYRVKKVPFGEPWKETYEQPSRSVLTAQEFEEALRDLVARAEPEAGDADLIDLERRLALLRLMSDSSADDRPMYLWLRGFPPGTPCDSAQRLAEWYVKNWGDGLGIEVDWMHSPPGMLASDRLLLLKGIHARPLATTEAGTHLFGPSHGNVVPVRVEVIDRWPFTPEDPFAFGPVLRTYAMGGSTLDLRTGLVAPTAEVGEELRTFTLAGLSTI